MPAYHPQRIEPKWQAYWETNKTFRAGDLDRSRPKLYILDMFPYPSGAGCTSDIPKGYTATDILCRYKRMRGFNVLHPMGWDAFGLPAEQYAIQTDTHPRIPPRPTSTHSAARSSRSGSLYDWDREVDTTDPNYYKWTQWIFLKLYDTWYDPEFDWTDAQGRQRIGKGRPIAELTIPDGVADARAYRDGKRLAYRALVPVNWCPALGTVLANEEVIDGKSERGGYPRRPHALDRSGCSASPPTPIAWSTISSWLDWPRPIKDMQRNWVGRSEGAEVDFPILLDDDLASWEVRRQSEGFRESGRRRDPDLHDPSRHALRRHLHGSRPRAPARRSGDHARQTGRRRRLPRGGNCKSDLDRTDLAKTKTGVFTGGYAINPVNNQSIPIWIADYVLIGYGTGAIMAVPGHDERDFEFAKVNNLPIVAVVRPPDEWLKHIEIAPEPEHDWSQLRADACDPAAFTAAYCDEGISIQSENPEFAITASRRRRPSEDHGLADRGRAGPAR